VPARPRVSSWAASGDPAPERAWCLNSGVRTRRASRRRRRCSRRRMRPMQDETALVTRAHGGRARAEEAMDPSTRVPAISRPSPVGSDDATSRDRWQRGHELDLLHDTQTVAHDAEPDGHGDSSSSWPSRSDNGFVSVSARGPNALTSPDVGVVATWAGALDRNGAGSNRYPRPRRSSSRGRRGRLGSSGPGARTRALLWRNSRPKSPLRGLPACRGRPGHFLSGPHRGHPVRPACTTTLPCCTTTTGS
jgi:hypothetical protein